MQLHSKGSSVSSDDIKSIFSGNSAALVLNGVPALARSRNGKVEYLIVGHKEWLEIPEGFLEDKKISHIENFPDEEPLVVVHLNFKQPTSDAEVLLMRMFLGSLSSVSRIYAHAEPASSSGGCGCEGKGEARTMTGPNYCRGCSYCGPCEPGYCYRSCRCNGRDDWCYDHVCCP